MIQISNLTKSFGAQTLLDRATFTIEPQERVGIVGRNGHGKSTLFRLIIGEDHQDSGEIIIPRDYRIGYLSQHLEFKEPNVLAEASSALPVHEGGWQEIHRAEEILAGLGFEAEDLEKPPSALSGGFQIRLNLAKCLLTEPNLLLLDEPTNYLDIVSIRWLQKFLTAWSGELMLITHDRQFMDAVTTHTVAIHRTKVRKASGGTEKIYTLLAEEEELHEQTRQNQERKFRQSEKFIERFRAKASKAKAVQSRIKQLEKIDRLEKRDEIDSLDFSFRAAEFPGKWLLNAKHVHFGYVPERTLVKDFTLAVGKEDRIAIIGQNGKGKSTLLNLLWGELKPSKGEVNHNLNTSIGYFGQTNVRRLKASNSVEQEISDADPKLTRTAVRSIAGLMMFEGDAALKKISVLSGGERSRVLLGKLLVAPANLLLLDEPTHHLDIESVENLIDALDDFPGAIVVVTHSEMILRRLAKRLVVFDGPAPEVFEGDYDDFLRRRGWKAEGGVPAKKPEAESKRSSLNQKEERRARAELQRLLGPAKKAVQNLETKIEQLDADLKAANDELAAAVERNDLDAVSRLSWTVRDITDTTNRAFDELEKAAKHLESETAKHSQALGFA